MRSKRKKNVVVISAGFKEAGREGAVLESELIRISDKYGLSVVCPNCLGIINTYAGLNATFGKATPSEGNIPFLSQSGAFALAVIDRSKVANVGFSKVVSLGNKAVLDECDFIEYLAKDDETAVIMMYLEDIREGRRFMDIVRHVTKTKPVVVMKSGRTEAGARAASSHTGSLAGSVDAFSTAFQQAGMVEANSITDLFDFSLTLSRIRDVKGGIAIVTNSGGPGVMASGAIEKIKSVKAYRILRGVRGKPMSDIDSLVDVLLMVSQISMAFPEILEADLNPIKVSEHGKGCYAIYFKMIMGERK